MKNVLNNSTNKNNTGFIIIFLIFFFLIVEYIIFYICSYFQKNNLNTEKIKIDSLVAALDSLTNDFFSITFTSETFDLFVSAQPIVLISIVTVVLFAINSMYGMSSEHKGIEQGSASWNKNLSMFKKDKKGFIIGDNLYMPLKHKKISYNLNQTIVGAPQSGKSFRKLIPDLLQKNSNYIVTDSKGDIYRQTAKHMIENGYIVKVLNLINMSQSMAFNPLIYIKDEKDVLIIADTFIRNTEGTNKSNSDSFWIKGETALLQALIFFVVDTYKNDEELCNFSTVQKFLLTSEINEKQGNNQLKVLDGIFYDLEKNNPARQCYDTFKLAAGETAAGILIGLAVRFNIFSSEELKRLTSIDEMDFDLFTRETSNIVIYIIIPDTYRTFDAISAMCFSTLLQHLVYKADFELEGSLPQHCRLLMDEFSNIGFIPSFDSFLTAVRSRNISITIILQELQQLKSKYKENWETLIGACDTLIYMGSQSNFTREYFSKMLGKTTVHNVQKTLNYSARGGRAEQRSNTGRELMTPDELRVIPSSHQIVFINGIKPIFTMKFRTEKKKMYKYLSSYKNNNILIKFMEKIKKEPNKEKVLGD